MTMIALPVPAGAGAGDWFLEGLYPEDAYRRLTWARFDAGGVAIGVAGAQFGDGRVERFVEVDDSIELDPEAARQVASALLHAAEALEAAR